MIMYFLPTSWLYKLSTLETRAYYDMMINNDPVLMDHYTIDYEINHKRIQIWIGNGETFCREREVKNNKDITFSMFKLNPNTMLLWRAYKAIINGNTNLEKIEKRIEYHQKRIVELKKLKEFY